MALTDPQAIDEARVRSIVSANDQLAISALAKSSKKLRNAERGASKMIRKAMVAADRESAICRTLECALQEAIDLAAACEALSSQVCATQPKFSAGQSVLYWWANWFSTTGPDLIKHFSKKSRPKWYSSEIISVGAFQDIDYAGSRVTGYKYVVA